MRTTRSSHSVLKTVGHSVSTKRMVATKDALFGLSVLASVGAASAQSFVTIDGTLDLSAQYIKNDGSSKRVSLSQDGLNNSQLRFLGKEDLGGGLWAGFLLNAGTNPDTGTVNSKFFNRRSTVSLGGSFGEFRVGRDVTPTYWNDTNYDAFGTNGVGSSKNIRQLISLDYVRADNSIGYFLPGSIGGVFGQVMASAGEGATPPGRYVGGRLGWGAGPAAIAAAYSEETYTAAGDKFKTVTIGGSYDFSVAKLLGYFEQTKLLVNKENFFSMSAVVPIGPGEIHVGFERSRLTSTGIATKVEQVALGYVYNLSRRTALYATGSRVSNSSASKVSLGSLGTSATAAPTLGGNSSGAEFGVRHFF